MKAIIFGSAGQDGVFLSNFLESAEYEVVGVSKQEVDVRDKWAVEKFLGYHREAVEVYNLAAQSHVRESFDKITDTWAVNTKGCSNILESMSKLGMKSKYMYASSREVFGKNYDLIDGVRTVNEKTDFMPISPYGASKASSHKIVQAYRRSGMFATNCILFNHESEIRPEKFVTRKVTDWIGRYIGWLKDGLSGNNGVEIQDSQIVLLYDTTKTFQKLTLGDLNIERDWGYAGDYVRAMWLSLQVKYPDDYIISTGESRSIAQLVETAFARIGVQNWQDYVYTSPVACAVATDSSTKWVKSPPTKANKILGWEPRTTFEDMINRMVDNDVQKNIQGSAGSE